MKKILYLILFFLSLALFSFSQEEKPGKPNDLDKQYTPDKNSILGSSKASSSNSGGGSGGDIQNIVKFNFALLARSTFAVFYERRIVEGFSVQGGVGYCYNKDRAQYFLSQGEDIPLSETSTSLSMGRIIKNGSYKPGFNPFMAVAIRFHFTGLYSYGYYGGGGDARNSYFELGARLNVNRYDVSRMNTANEKIIGDTKVNIRNMCYTMTYGYLFETDTKLVTTHEFYTGFGIRKSTYDKFSSEQVNSPLGGYSLQHTKTGGKESLFTPMFMVGYVLGFGF
ncbi:MAG: hypothetical protein ACJ76F_07315 [Bacteroidia bacterium]